MSELFYLVGYGLAATMTAVAFLSWRKAMGFHVLLLESTNRFIALRNRSTQLESELEKSEKKLEHLRDTSIRLEKSLAFEKSRNDTSLAELKEENQNLKDLVHSRELKIDHLSKQVDAVMEQLKEADYAKVDAERRLAYSSKDSQDRYESQKQQLSFEVESWKKKFRLVEGEFHQFKKQLEEKKRREPDLDPQLVQQLKRKADHFESLYKSMRGLREMSDERNKNWEIALRKFSAWILRHSESKHQNPESMPLGPMVGEALDIIGARLLEDEFSADTGENPVLNPKANPSLETPRGP